MRLCCVTVSHYTCFNEGVMDVLIYLDRIRMREKVWTLVILFFKHKSEKMDPKYSRVYLDGLLLNYQLNKLMGVIDTSDAVVAVD